MELNALVDIQLDRGTATNQIPVWNDTTKRFVPSTTLTGITLGTPWTLEGNGTWTGDSAIDISDNNKGISIKDNTALALFVAQGGHTYFQISTLDGQEKIDIGPSTFSPGPEINFLSDGIANFSGPVELDQIGPNDGTDPDLIELALGSVVINGDLTVGTAYDSMRRLDVLGGAGTAGEAPTVGQDIVAIAGVGGEDTGGGAGQRTGANGGLFDLRSGDGGESSGSDGFPARIGGVGGQFALVAGCGGAATDATTKNNTGGRGGFYEQIGGDGGVASGATSGNNLGGAGGKLDVFGGDGGDATNGGTNTGGAGANVNIKPGSGGTGATANGADGIITIGDGGVTDYTQISATGDRKYVGSAKALNLAWDTETFTSDDTLGTDNVVALVDGSLNTVTITLPSAVGIENRVYYIKSINGTFTTDVATNASETIDGDSSWTLAAGETITIVSDNANWWII